eukprot:7140461-Alexandrium_andersonii.AAC.1
MPLTAHARALSFEGSNSRLVEVTQRSQSADGEGEDGDATADPKGLASDGLALLVEEDELEEGDAGAAWGTYADMYTLMCARMQHT